MRRSPKSQRSPAASGRRSNRFIPTVYFALEPTDAVKRLGLRRCWARVGAELESYGLVVPDPLVGPRFV